MPEDFISGRDLLRKVYFDNQVWSLNMKSVRIEELATEITDQVGGEDRARFDKVTDGFRITVTAFIDSNTLAFENYLAQIAATDAGGPQPALAAGFVFKYRNLSRGGLTFKDCTLDPFDMDDSDRPARIMFTVKFRARHMAKVPA